MGLVKDQEHTMDITFHYPPELFKLLTDTIPKLCKSKNDLMLFFQGAGVSQSTLDPHFRLLHRDKSSFNKYHVTRDILTQINASGEATLRVRREILKRVTDIEDFSCCWENERAAGRGLVSQIRDMINTKDSFTRMKIEKDEERRKRIAEQEAKSVEASRQKARKEKVKADLFALFGENDTHKRGKALEKVLNELFETHGILVRESFTIKGACGEGIIEQIDGLIELDSHLYLVELKWWNTPIGVAEVAPHLVRLYSRGKQVRGLFISYTDFTAPAITQCREALSGGAVIILATLQEIVNILNSEGSISTWLKVKLEAALVDKQPYAIRLE